MAVLWLRADGSPSRGLGHVMRNIALAEEAVARGWTVRFVVEGHEAQRLPPRHGFTMAPADSAWTRHVTAEDLVVFDGYHFGPSDHASVRHAACVAAVDDLGTGEFDVDLLLNPNATDASACTYSLPVSATLLLGPRHALVRREFREHRRLRDGGAGKLMVTLGGSDAAGLAQIAMELAPMLSEQWRIRLLLGPAAPTPQVAAGVEVVRDPPRVSEVFDKADAALSAAGSTTWELLAMGVPTTLIQATDNQRQVLATAVSAGAALSAGSAEDRDNLRASLPAVLRDLADPGRQRALSAAALALVDGRGAERVLAALESRGARLPGAPGTASHR